MNVQGANAHIDPPSLCWRCVKITICDKEKCVVKYVDSVLNPDMKRVAKCNKFQAIMSVNISPLTDAERQIEAEAKAIAEAREKELNEIFEKAGITVGTMIDTGYGIISVARMSKSKIQMVSGKFYTKDEIAKNLEAGKWQVKQ